MGTKTKLILGGTCSMLVSVLHVFLLFFLDNQAVMTFFGAPRINGSNIRTFGEPLFIWSFSLTLGIAVLFFLFGLYAFSGAGKIKPFPFLKHVLMGIGIVYCIRGLGFFVDIYLICQQPYFYLVKNPDYLFSLFSGATGYFYLSGLQVIEKQSSLPNTT